MMFHLAIPAKDLIESIGFYKTIGFKVGRNSNNFAILDFFKNQVVLHKSDKIDLKPEMYPRHFGIIFEDKEDLDFRWRMWSGRRDIFRPLFVRYDGKPEEHHTFFMKDPSNNIVEFKWYKHPDAIFG